MKISPVRQNYTVSFKSQTAYFDKKVEEQDALTLDYSKSLFSNPVSPNQNFIGFNLIKNDDQTIYIKSRFDHIIGTIKHKGSNLPKVNIIGGSHQPVIELVDEDLGIKVLLNRGSEVIGNNLNIDYKELNSQKIFVNKKGKISFGNNLFITTGYKSEKTDLDARNYFKNRENYKVEKSFYADYIKNDYSLVGLAAGYGTRLKPVIDLENTNKPATKYPSTNKSLLDISCFDTAARAGKIQHFFLLKDGENNTNLTGTAGPIIKNLRSGLIPTSKPLVVLTGDTFNNIDLAKVLYDFERSDNTGIGVVVKDVSKGNLFNVPLVKIQKDNSIEKFHEKINNENYEEIIKENKNFYTATNIMVIHPKILEYLKKFGDENCNADFLDFMYLMHNVMNKPLESLERKYPQGLGNKELKLEDLTDTLGYPEKIYSDKNYTPLKVNAIYAQDINGKTPKFSDIGTIDKFIETLHEIKNSRNINGISNNFIKKIDENINEDGVIFMQESTQDKFRQFQQKYGIKAIRGNVIVSEILSKKSQNILENSLSPYSKIAKENTREFIEKIMKNPDDLKKISKDLIAEFGLNEFLKWYLSNDGYYGAYEKYVDDFYKNATSIEELLKFMPNWSPWKLEEKYWRLQNKSAENISENYAKFKYSCDTENVREQPFKIGKLPVSYFSPEIFDKLVHKIREDYIEEKDVYINGCRFGVKRLKGGDLNDKFIFKIKRYDKDFILKMDRCYTEDNHTVSMYDQKVIKKNKVLMADSNFTNACISKYLELNGCDNIPKLIYYDYRNDAALYEYVKDKRGDLFQKGEIDTEYSDLNMKNEVTENLRNRGIYLNDTALKNFFKDVNGSEKIIDLGHSNFIMPFKPGVKHYNVEFANINGPDLRTIYSSLL